MAWQKKSPDTAGESIDPNGDLDKPASNNQVAGSFKSAGKLGGGKMSHEKLGDKMSKSWGC